MTSGTPRRTPVRPLQVGEVLSETWVLYTQNLARLVATAALAYALLSLVLAVVSAVVSARPLFLALTIGVTIVGVYWVQGALVALVADLRAGRSAVSVGTLFRRVEPRLATLIGAGLLAAVGIALGFLLLVVPGLVLLTWWSMITPIVTLENAGVLDSFGRSRELVRGNGWRVLAVIALTVVFAAIVSTVITALFVGLPEFVAIYVGSVVANAVTVPFVALAWTVTYFELRDTA
jgi:hypothetical protein